VRWRFAPTRSVIGVSCDVSDDTDVGIRQTAPRTTTPGAEFTYRLTYDNTRDLPSNSFTVTDILPAGRHAPRRKPCTGQPERSDGDVELPAARRAQ
jgi:uncharacterized repeat protein (TIGR01451 family)